MPRLSRFDRVTLAAVLALALTAGALSVASARLGPAVDGFTTAHMLAGISVDTEIALSFTEPMNLRSVERSFHLAPSVPGDFTWTGNELFFLPRHSLRYAQTYAVTVSTGAEDRQGRHLLRPFRAAFTTQTHHLIYLGTQGGEQGRLVLAGLTGQRRVVGSDDGLVTDFSLSFDRTLVTYVKRGARSERPNELRLLSLADGSTQLLFRHPDWSMSQPHFSPDGRYIVFLASNVMLCQKYYGCYRDTTGPVIYLFDLRSHRLHPFHAVSDVPITNFIDFSPAGQLAYTDLGSALTLADPSGRHIVHIPNRGNSLEFASFDSTGASAAFVGQTPDSSGGDILVYTRGKYLDVSRGVYDSSTPAFSASGGSIAYAAYHGEQGIEPVYGINVYDFKTGRTRRLTANRQWSDWSPAWSPDDSYLAFVRSQPQEAMYMGSGEIWVVRSNGRDARPLGGVGASPSWIG